MNTFKLAILPLVASGFLTAIPATAAPLLFEFTGQSISSGPVSASFQLDSNPTPDTINDQGFIGGQIFFNNVPGVFNGTAQTASMISFGTGLLSQFQYTGTTSGFAQFGGQTNVFTGTLANPVFTPGTFKFTGFSSGTLTVSAVAAAVPEPATWAMMLVGFGAIGLTMRRRRSKVRTTVSLA